MSSENGTIHTILNRRSIRSYKKEQISNDELETILLAGSAAPSGMNGQSAYAYVIQSEEFMSELVKSVEKATGIGRNPFYDAPTVIIVFADSSKFSPVEDGTLAIENMMLAAYSLGIGSCWIYAVKQFFATEEGRTFKKKLGVPDNQMIIGSVALGYPDGKHPALKTREHKFYKKF